FAASNAERRQRDVERQPRRMSAGAAAGVQRAAQVGGDGTGWRCLGVHGCERSVGAVPTQAAYSPMLRRPPCPRDGALLIWGVLAADDLGPSNLPIQYRFGSLNH